MSEYINELNESQHAAVVYNEGPSLVIAGAGSGKTRVLTYKIAYLLDSGYAPWTILALTFTNKAAREMKERIARQVGEKRARYLWMGTFHSIFSRILRTEAEHIGFTSNFTIYDSADSKSLIRAIIREMGLDDKTYKPGIVQSRISNAKNQLVDPVAYLSNREMSEYDRSQKVPEMGNIYQRYWDRCKQAGAMDFDDLLFYTYLLFDKYPEIKHKYSEQFQFILVDEYQDTNFAQHQIVLQLTQEHQKVCVVGDDAQSIYSFRGANIDNILKFTDLYKNAKIFKLEQNYRSTKTIVGAANSLIEKNQRQIPKSVFSEKQQGEPITVFNAYSDVEEGEFVANKIMELRKKDSYEYNDFAILYRTNAQSRIFEESLRKRSIPYKIYGGLSFYQRKEIKDVVAYFRMVVNPHDEEAFKRIINYPSRKIGDTTLNKIINAATARGISLWDVITNPIENGLDINKATLGRIQGFHNLISGFMTESTEKNVHELGSDIIINSGIMRELMEDDAPENMSRRENIDELLNAMFDFYATRQEEGDDRIFLTDFLSEIALFTDQDSDKSVDTEKVTLMTVHAAKGLEFKNVFVVGMEENLFPSLKPGATYHELEEERRLFYVAITRAEEHCFLSFSKSRFRYGKMEFCTPSRFLRDIDMTYLKLPQDEFSVDQPSTREDNNRFHKLQQEREKRSIFREETKERSTSSVAGTTPNFKKVAETKISASKMASDSSVTNNGFGLQVGQMIEHERFGIGEVIAIEGTGDNTKATVRFRNAGVKQLLLKFARFTIIG